MNDLLQLMKNVQQQKTKKADPQYTQGWIDAVETLGTLLVAATVVMPPPVGQLQLTDVAVLAHAIWGERPNLVCQHEMAAAEKIGMTFLNRLTKGWWGTSYADVATGFHGYNPEEQVPAQYFELAQKLIILGPDSAMGTLFIMSLADLKKHDRVSLTVHASWSYAGSVQGTQYGLYGFTGDPMKIEEGS